MLDVMPAETAEWIRANAWTGKMRETFREVPGFFLACACEYGLTTHCRNRDHGACHCATPLPSSEAKVCRRGGDRPAHFKRPLRHKVLISATGPHRTRYAEVWLADRVCRWLCPCTCHTLGRQLDLFAPAGDAA